MATATITHTVKDNAGAAVPNAKVTARLNEPGFRSDGSSIARLSTFYANSSGLVSMVLERNADITPAGSTGYYIISIDLPPSQGGSERYTARATINQTLQLSLVSV